MPRKSTPGTNKFEVAASLQEIGQLLEAKGVDHFRARAYRNAARSIADFSGDLGALGTQDRLTEIKGIGLALAAQVKEILATGRSSFLERLRAELPPGVIELSRILNLKKIEKLHKELGIGSLPELKAAIQSGKVRTVPGFGVKSEQQLLAAIERYENRGERILLLHASRMGRRILSHMELCPDVRNIEVAGAIRRWKETVGTIRIIASCARAPARLIDHFLRLPSITEIEARTKTACIVRLAEDMRVSFTVVLTAQYPVALHHETGSKTYVGKMQSLAEQRGFSLTDTALLTRPRPARSPGSVAGQPRRRGTLSERSLGRVVTLKTEADIFQHLDMPYIPPELRED